MERIAPAPKDNSVSFTLPQMNNALDASQAAGSVLTAVSQGNLTPIEALFIQFIQFTPFSKNPEQEKVRSQCLDNK